jgi:outer membrane protein assembly factor BamD
VTRVLLLSAVLVLGLGCPKRPEVPRPGTSREALEVGLDLLEKKDWKRAEEALTYVIFNFPGSRQASDAQYFLAESYFRRGDYVSAQTEYDFYLKSFPNGRYQEDAYYKLAMSYFESAPSGSRDNSRINQARDLLKDFLLLYPDSETRPMVEQALDRIGQRMAGQDFATARLYFKAKEYRSALVYFLHVAGSLEPERWEPVDRLSLAVCYFETGKEESARELLAPLTEPGMPENIRQQAGEYLARLDNP